MDVQGERTDPDKQTGMWMSVGAGRKSGSVSEKNSALTHTSWCKPLSSNIDIIFSSVDATDALVRVIRGMLLNACHVPTVVYFFFVFLHTYTNRFLPPWNTRHIVVPVGGNLSRRWHRVTNTHWHLQADDKGDQRLAWERTCHCSLTVDIKDSMVLMNHVTVFSRGNRGGCFGEVMISHTPQGFLLNQWELPTQKPTALLKWFKQFQTAFPNVGRRKAAGLCIPNDPNSNLTCHKAAK